MRFRLLAVLPVALALACVDGPPEPSVPAEETFAASLGVDIPNMVKISDDLYYKDVVVGTGSPAVAFGKTIYVQYAGYFVDGTKFDEVAAPDSTAFVLNGQVIAGWQLGLPGMKPGGTRKLVIGSSYAYGSAGRDKIPPNATLVFDVTVKTVK